ncbi:hypothetical protein APA_2506 [Pseudanabaena sp. lw0831]|nr:hypothetical protein APA_2506 [Pseudanabaena sp. lw0831]
MAIQLPLPLDQLIEILKHLLRLQHRIRLSKFPAIKVRPS